MDHTEIIVSLTSENLNSNNSIKILNIKNEAKYNICDIMINNNIYKNIAVKK